MIAKLFIIFIFLSAPFTGHAEKLATLDTSSLDQALVRVVTKESDQEKLKNYRVLIVKDGNQYTYSLRDNGAYPLQLGNGDYAIALLENVENKTYKVVDKKNIRLNIEDEFTPFLNSNDILNWSKDMEPIKMATNLTDGMKKNREKVEVIYEYVVNNIKYDFDKASRIKEIYNPSIESTFESSKGICYDYASLFGSMTRSVDVPTKLVTGYKNDIPDYHSWNEVYFEDNKNWNIVDTTYDAAYIQAKKPVNMIKDPNEYKVKLVY